MHACKIREPKGYEKIDVGGIRLLLRDEAGREPFLLHYSRLSVVTAHGAAQASEQFVRTRMAL